MRLYKIGEQEGAAARPLRAGSAAAHSDPAYGMADGGEIVMEIGSVQDQRGGIDVGMKRHTGGRRATLHRWPP